MYVSVESRRLLPRGFGLGVGAVSDVVVNENCCSWVNKVGPPTRNASGMPSGAVEWLRA